MLKFSIIIPTRNRDDTLPFSIRTVLDQDFDDYELVVCDNCSSDNTKAVVDSFHSEKIVYIRSDVPLPMHENWELAVSKSNGKYLILFGDDDGLLPHALALLDKILSATTFKAIAWERVYYSWPNITPEYFANRLMVPIEKKTYLIEGDWIIKEVAEGRRAYTLLPMLYNSVIDRELVDVVIRKTGRIFRSVIPDIYSGFAFAYLAKDYLYINSPFTINGGSKKSNGANYFFNNDNSVKNEFDKLSIHNSLGFHSKVPYIKNMTAVIVESYYQFQESILSGNIVVVDREVVFKKILNEIKSMPIDEWQDSVVKIKECLRDEPQLLRRLINYGLLDRREVAKINNKQVGGFENNFLNINASDFDCYNVYDVAFFCEKLIYNRDKGALDFSNYASLRSSRYFLLKKWIKSLLRGIMKIGVSPES